MLLAASDGHPLIDAKVEPEPALAEIYVLALGDQYILVTNRLANGQNDQESNQPMPGMGYRPILSGLVYGFDRQGKVLWPKPVPVEHQHLVTEQPARLPVVTFACQAYRRRIIGQGEYSCPILCIDKRTGRVLLREKLLMPTMQFEISGDPEKRIVQLRLHQVLTLTFTDKPWSQQRKGFLPALWDSFREGLHEAVHPSRSPDAAKDLKVPSPQGGGGGK